MTRAGDSPDQPSWLRKQCRALAAAFTFMTRLPLGSLVAHDLADLPASVIFFPVVGLIVGAIGAASFAFAQMVWSPFISVVLAVIATVMTTGAFHEDALADSLDGFGGGWTKEQVLTIMKDSRVGSYALIGVVLIVLAKVATLLSMATPFAQTNTVWNVARAMIAAHVLSRWSSVWLIRSQTYVRVEELKAKPNAGRPFVSGTTRSQFVAASVISLVVVAPILQWHATVAVFATIVVTIVAGRYFRRRIGGITGDALGAANQIVELAVYLVLAAKPLAGI